MKAGETGTVVQIFRGVGIQNRMRALGIWPGVKVTKVSPPFGRGPVILKVGGSQTVLGYGVSHKVFVEVNR